MLRSLLFVQCFSNSSPSDLPKNKNHKFFSRHVLRKDRKNFEDKKFLLNGYLAQLLDKSIPVAFNSTLWREKAFIRDRITARKGKKAIWKTLTQATIVCCDTLFKKSPARIPLNSRPAGSNETGASFFLRQATTNNRRRQVWWHLFEVKPDQTLYRCYLSFNLLLRRDYIFSFCPIRTIIIN